MSALKCTSNTGNLDRTNGHWSTVTGNEQVATNIGTALRIQRGELFWDKNVGTPILERILGSNDVGIVTQTVKQAILSVDGVLQVLSLTATLGDNRSVAIAWSVQATSGDIVQGVDNLVFGDL